MRADTLLLCAQLSRLHTQVWEAVCRRGSQLHRERRACDRGTSGLVQGAVGAQGEGAGKPEPPHRRQVDTRTDGGEISREVNPPEGIMSVSVRHLSQSKGKMCLQGRFARWKNHVILETLKRNIS